MGKQIYCKYIMLTDPYKAVSCQFSFARANLPINYNPISDFSPIWNNRRRSSSSSSSSSSRNLNSRGTTRRQLRGYLIQPSGCFRCPLYTTTYVPISVVSLSLLKIRKRVAWGTFHFYFPFSQYSRLTNGNLLSLSNSPKTLSNSSIGC